MVLTESVKLFFINYINFEGRTRRRDFWFALLGLFLIGFLLAFIDSFLTAGLLTSVFGLAIIVPQISLMVRRLHDIGMNGLWVLLLFVPLVGFVCFLIWGVTESNSSSNQWGPPANRY